MLTMTQPNQSKRQRHAGTRTCVGCGARVDKERVKLELVRLVLVPLDGDDSLDGDRSEAFRAHVDLSGSSVGRGSWVHARSKCFDDACARGLARSAKAKVFAERDRLRTELVDQAARRIRSLIGTAARGGRAAVGSDAVRDAVRRELAVLLVVATDAAAAAKHAEVQHMVQAGAAVPYGTKALLGEALGRGEVGVMAITDDGMAAALRHTIGLSETFAHD